MKSAIPLALFTAALLCIWPALGQTSGAITGAVSSEDGSLPAGLAVVLHKIPEYVDVSKTGISQPRVVLSSIRPAQVLGVSSTGSFSASGVPSGHYKLCAAPPDGYLDTCLWSGPVDVILAPGSSSAGGNLRLRRGAVVRIRLNDPQSLLPAVQTAYVEKGVVAGVMTATGAFRPARVRSRDAKGTDLVMTVPYNTPLRLWISPRQVSVRAPNGTTLLHSGPYTTFQASALSGTVEFQFEVGK
ncbi:MAG: hypothetical protein IT167_03570 [Bryobacterales bacterium]|nr:hypothetical protein [Bryobacterales bacterium]